MGYSKSNPAETAHYAARHSHKAGQYPSEKANDEGHPLGEVLGEFDGEEESGIAGRDGFHGDVKYMVRSLENFEKLFTDHDRTMFTIDDVMCIFNMKTEREFEEAMAGVEWLREQGKVKCFLDPDDGLWKVTAGVVMAGVVCEKIDVTRGGMGVMVIDDEMESFRKNAEFNEMIDGIKEGFKRAMRKVLMIGKRKQQ